VLLVYCRQYGHFGLGQSIHYCLKTGFSATSSVLRFKLTHHRSLGRITSGLPTTTSNLLRGDLEDKEGQTLEQFRGSQMIDDYVVKSAVEYLDRRFEKGEPADLVGMLNHVDY
jgi:hypothetical protein